MRWKDISNLFITAVGKLQDETTKCNLGLVRRKTEFPGGTKPKKVVLRWGRSSLPSSAASRSSPILKREVSTP